MIYNKVEYLVLKNLEKERWIDFSEECDNYNQLQKDSHFGLPNLKKTEIMEQRMKYCDSIINAIEKIYSDQKKSQKPLNIRIKIDFDGIEGDKLYRVVLLSNDIIERTVYKENKISNNKEYLTENGKWVQNKNDINKSVFYNKIINDFIYKHLIELLIKDM